MTTPKAFDFGEEPAPPPVAAGPPRALSFDDLPLAPSPGAPPASGPRALFESEDHPAVRDALALARADYPGVFAQSEQRLAALFRRLLPVKLASVTEWAEGP